MFILSEIGFKEILTIYVNDKSIGFKQFYEKHFPEEVAYFTFLQTSLMSGLIGNRLILITGVI